MMPKSSKDLPGPAPRHDAQRDAEEAAIADTDKNDGSDRDSIHGDGSEIGLDTD